MNHCPLCRAGYRQGFLTCATCGATLVASLDSGEVRANPPRLLWIGRDSVEFDLIVRALRIAQVPANVEQGLGGLIGSLVHSESKIHVLRGDFDRALEIAAEAITARKVGRSPTQVCHACAAECSASLAACPVCKAALIVEPVSEHDARFPAVAGSPTDRKYCPVCDAAYSAGHYRCTICGVELVPEELRGLPLSDRDRNERIEVVWRGGDPLAVSEAVAALREAGIRHSADFTRDYYVFGLAMPQPRQEIRVFASDVARAKELLAGIPQGFAIGAEGSPVTASEAKEKSRTTRQRPAGPWNPAAATVEIWTGEDAALARLLEDCLRENRIGVRCGGREPGIMRLSVMPQDEAAAREIVREIIEAAPPE
jgi:hypothetical protein